MMYTTKEVLESSLAEFKELQSPGLFEKFRQTELRDLKLKILEIQTSQERQKSMTDFSRILSFIVAFDGFAETFGLTQEQTACIWGPVKYVLHVAKDDVKALDDILQSYRGLATRIPSIQPYTSLVTEKPEVSICLAFMYQDLLQFQKSLLKLLTGHDWKATFHTKWKDYDKGSFPNILKSFDHHKRTLQDLLRAHHYQKSNENHQISNEHYQLTSDMSQRFNNHLQNYQDDRQDLEAHIRRYEEDRDELLRNARAQEKQRKEEQFDAVMKWVSAPRSLQVSLHELFTNTRAEFPGTTDWILKNPKVENWIHADTPTHSVLCITGKKGAGKTILASRIIDHCVEHGEDFKTSYFYCREGDSSQNNCLAVYKCLLIQMLRHYPDLLPSCHDRRLRGNEMLNEETPAKALIGLFCNADMKQFIIIDGVDEIDSKQRKPLVQYLVELVEKCEAYKPGKVRVLFISHDLADYDKQKCMEEVTTLHLNSDIIQKDIKIFVSKKAKELKREVGLTDQELQTAQDLTLSLSDGMFLFAHLAMENLLKQLTVESAKQQLQADVFPRDLQEAYHKIVDRLQRDLSDNGWFIAKKIFGWLACAKRPLHWHEIEAALSMELRNDDALVRMDYHNRRLRKDIREICGSLVQKLGNRIVFTHHTAKVYIADTEHLNTASIECDFTITCLKYLSSSCFQRDLAEDRRMVSIKQGHYAFQDYALAKWGHHLAAFIESGPNLLHRLALRQGECEPGVNCVDDLLLSLSRAFSQFAGVYHSDLVVTDDAGDRIVRATEECRAFDGYDFYDDLVNIWAHFSSHQKAHFKELNKVSLPSLATASQQIRTMLDSLSTAQQKELEDLYGDCIFKCDRVTCDYFYEGFETKERRDAHLQRHDRPYHCPVSGCSVAAFGFSTNKDREKHVRMYHPDESSASTFIQLPRELIEDARFSCPECGQTFTRKANKDAHVRSHYGDRPYVCSICTNKAFTRSNDLRRHDRQIHSRRKVV
ncbi:hypothetical protein HD806DRAFT_268528 [Xylariaceae sp. AK1471]|nr:hypothetical protein HD806DRAFT_268528 [Xylariaceae sp. AK1471]